MIPVDTEEPEPIEQHRGNPGILVDVHVGEIGGRIDDRRRLALPRPSRRSGRIGACRSSCRQFLACRHVALRPAIAVDEIRIEIGPDLRLPEEIAVEPEHQHQEGEDGALHHPVPLAIPAVCGHERPDDPGDQQPYASPDGLADPLKEGGNPVEHRCLLVRRGASDLAWLTHMCSASQAQRGRNVSPQPLETAA